MEDIAELIEDCPHSTAKDEGQGFALIRTPNIGIGHLIFDNVHRVSKEIYDIRNARAVPQINDIIYAREAPAGNAAIINDKEKVCLGQRTVLIRPMQKWIDSMWLTYTINSPYARKTLISKATGSTVTHVNMENIRSLALPLPPLQEQSRIVENIEHWLSLVDCIEESNNNLQEAIRQTKSKILDLAIHGKLVPQDPTDEPASELLKRIDPKAEITCDNGHYQKNEQFEIPSTWVLCKLGAVNEIARGGSPRPIKDYLTNDANGINWIKIGDTTKDGKYINSVKEKIRPEGVKKSRLVHKGDFLLTNSMSYGRPYILNVDGCIHDGWLVISPIGKAYTSDFLYYLLSSSFAYDQFTNVASGGVVTNLNSDKVADTIFPLPPYTEQERIVAKIEEIFAQLDAIEASL